MYFPAEHFVDKLEISPEQLSDFEQRGVVKGIARTGRVFYSSRDLYRLKGDPALHESWFDPRRGAEAG